MITADDIKAILLEEMGKAPSFGFGRGVFRVAEYAYERGAKDQAERAADPVFALPPIMDTGLSENDETAHAGDAINAIDARRDVE